MKSTGARSPNELQWLDLELRHQDSNVSVPGWQVPLFWIHIEMHILQCWSWNFCMKSWIIAIRNRQIYLELEWKYVYIIICRDFKSVAIIKSLRPSEAIWQRRSGSTLAQVMACCLTAPSHYLNQCWLIISMVYLHSSEGNFIRDTSATVH